MGKVIPFKQKTKIQKVSEFDERMSRIKESVEKINSLIAQLKVGVKNERRL